MCEKLTFVNFLFAYVAKMSLSCHITNKTLN